MAVKKAQKGRKKNGQFAKGYYTDCFGNVMKAKPKKRARKK